MEVVETMWVGGGLMRSSDHVYDIDFYDLFFNSFGLRPQGGEVVCFLLVRSTHIALIPNLSIKESSGFQVYKNYLARLLTKSD